MGRRSSFVLRIPHLAMLAALSTAGAQAKPDLQGFAAIVPELRARIAAQDWEGFAAAARPFAALQPDLQRRDELDDLLNALRELGVLRTPPADAMTQGLLADSFAVPAVADACYQEHIAAGPAESWSVKSAFVGYRARLAVQRGDLDAALTLLADQRRRCGQERYAPIPEVAALVDAHLRAVRELMVAPDDPWRRLAFARAYWRTATPPILAAEHGVRRELGRLLGEEAVQREPALLLAIRCEQIAGWPVRDDVFDAQALPAAVACVDAGLPAAAARRSDVADPWSPLLRIGRMLQRAQDPARALVAYDALVAGAAALPQHALLVHEALVAGAECALDRGDGAGALARLDRAERGFPFRSGCGTCDMAEERRIARLRERARAGGGR